MIDERTAPYSALLLRLAMGILFLLHGAYLKIFVFTMDGTSQYFESLGLPGWFAWAVMLYETIGGAALILGVYARWAALFLGVHLLAVAYVAHGGAGWFFTNPGGGYEYPLLWAAACFALALLGDGAGALKGGRA